MVLLRGDWRKEYYGTPGDLPVGCAGRMVSVEPLPDGRYNILLHGVREFTIVGERARRSRTARARSSGARRRKAAYRPSCATRIHALDAALPARSASRRW